MSKVANCSKNTRTLVNFFKKKKKNYLMALESQDNQDVRKQETIEREAH